MATALALLAALGLPAAETGELRLTNVRPTYCVLGPVRAADKVLPGDSYVLSFDIEGITTDDAGKARYSVGVDVSDADGKLLELKRAGTAARWTFVVGKDGKIAYKNTKVTPAADAKAINEFIAKELDKK